MKKSEIKNITLILLLIFSFVVGGAMTIGILKFTPVLDSLGKSTTIKGKNVIYDKSSLAAAVDNIYDAVVMIKAYQDEEEYSTGTGFVYKTDSKYGYLITNQHVVSGAKNVTVTMSNDEVVDAKVLGGDEYLDIAVLSIPKEKVTLTATISNDDNLQIGDTIFTVGSPMGEEYRGSVTSGILSGKARMVSVSVGNSNTNDWVMKALQIDAAINPGNSGGPLLNAKGEVIGVTSMKLVRDEIEGMGFAIPIDMAMAHIDSLEKGQKIAWPYIGIDMANTNDVITLYRYGIDIGNIKEGVVVTGIVKDSAAKKANLKAGDVITKINNQGTKNIAYLRYELYKYKPGDVIEVTYIRNGKEEKTKVELTKK